MKNRGRLALMMAAVVAIIAGGAGEAAAYTVATVTKATSTAMALPTTCPTGQTYDPISKTCKTITSAGTSSATFCMMVYTPATTTQPGYWSLVLTMQEFDGTLYQHTLYTFAGDPPPADNPDYQPPLPNDYVPRTVVFDGFDFAPPQFFTYEPTYNPVLWNRVTFSTAVVPEPSTIVLLGAGLAGLGGLAIRRRMKAKRE